MFPKFTNLVLYTMLTVWPVLFDENRVEEWPCMAEIFWAESSWNPYAIGDSSKGGSYGLPQRHAIAHGKPDWPWPIRDQALWTLEYADERYGGVCEGAVFRKEHGWW